MSMSSGSIARQLDALKAKRDEAGDDGFTLIELLVVVVIIGILVAIAIPLYLQYQNGAKNKSAESDVRGAISTAEQFYANNNSTYAATTGKDNSKGTTSSSFDLGTDAKVTVGAGNMVGYVLAGDGLSYTVCGANAQGKHVFSYNSSAGGSVTDQGAKTLDITTCTWK